jgi:hypothetical protein
MLPMYVRNFALGLLLENLWRTSESPSSNLYFLFNIIFKMSTFWHYLASSYSFCFHIIVSFIILQSIHQPTKTLDTKRLITSLKLLHVPASFSGSLRERNSHVKQPNQVLHRPRWYHYNIRILKHTKSTSTNLQCCDTKTVWQWQSTVAHDLYAVCIQTAVSFLRDPVNMLATSVLHK